MTEPAPYQDPAQPVDSRVEDLLARMTLAEKAGLMFHTMIDANADGTLAEPGNTTSAIFDGSTTELVAGLGLTHFNVLSSHGPRQIAEWHNRLQELAASTRLGIPVTISSDPRHAGGFNPGASIGTKGFSRWPEPIGLAATADPDLVREFADIARREYLAVGIRVALHPMADLATEPRWARIAGTFGEDATMAAAMVGAYVEGFQGPALGPDSVACMVKHFPGGGPQADGEDPHFHYGKEQVYPGGMFEHHMRVFDAAFAAGVSQVMPYYGMPIGVDGVEEVGFGYNADVITGLLRGRYGFTGIVCTDWQLITDTVLLGADFPARAWGVEHLDPLGRVEKILAAGCDQFGGESRPELIVELVESGRVPESRLDASVRRILWEKFVLGLFDDRRYVDPDEAEEIVGSADFVAAGLTAQHRSIVVLTDRPWPADAVPAAGVAAAPTLPLREGIRVTVDGFDPTVVAGYATVVDDPAEAEVALVRLAAPYEPRTNGLERFFHAGSLAYPPAELERLGAALAARPTVVDVFLDRPAVLPEVVAAAAAVVGSFGATDQALLDVLFGRVPAAGKLPFQLPRSMEQVERQRPDVPFDLDDPLFDFGHGLSLVPGTAPRSTPPSAPAKES